MVWVTWMVYESMPYAPRGSDKLAQGAYPRALHPWSPHGSALMAPLQGHILVSSTPRGPHGRALMGRP